jgi:hypothetical protein
VRVQVFPDRVRGDGGLEAWVADEGIAFQCYAPESPFGVAQQTEAQRNKIRIDTKKLMDRAELTQDLIGAASQIRQWVLLTPSFEDKSLVAYAARRSAEVIAHAASWCHPDFRISIHNETLFAEARARLLGVNPNRIAAVSTQVDLDALRASGEIISSIDETLVMKFGADSTVAARPSLLNDYKEETLADYVRGKTELARLSREAVSVHRVVGECAELIFSRLSLSIAESDERPLVVVKTIRSELFSAMKTRLPQLGDDLCERLARFYVASWWIECPLRFEVANA